MIENAVKRFPELDKSKFRKNIWEMHPDETSVAFELFSKYRDMPVPRSMVKLAESIGTSRGGMSYYSAACYWDERARAYDAYLDIEVGKEKIKALKSMKKKHIDSMRVTTNALMIPIVELVKRSNDGRVNIENLNLMDLLTLVNKNAAVLTRVVDTERKVNDQPTDIIDNQYSNGAPQIIVVGPEVNNERVKEILEERRRKLEADDDNL